MGAADDPVLEQLRSTLGATERLDRGSLDGLEDMVVAVGEVYRRTTRPMSLIPTIRGVMQTVSTDLQGVRPETAAHRHLLSLAGELCGYLGWVHWDAGDMAAAEESFTCGLTCAAQAGDKALGAYLIGCNSVWPMRIEDPQRRLNRLDSNFNGITAADATPQVWGWLQALRAGAYAKAGRTLEFWRTRDIVDGTFWDVAQNPRRRPRVDFFTRSYWGEELATYLLYIGEEQARHASEATEIIAASLPTASPQVRTWLMVDLAEAWRQRREPERAIEAASAALTEARKGHMGSAIASLRDLPGKMRHMPCRELREFEEQLHIA